MEFIALNITLPIIDPNFEQQTSILMFCRLLHPFRSVNWKNIPQHEGILEWAWKSLFTDWSEISGRYIYIYIIFTKGKLLQNFWTPKLKFPGSTLKKAYPPPSSWSQDSPSASTSSTRRNRRNDGGLLQAREKSWRNWAGCSVEGRPPKRNAWSNLYHKWCFRKGILPKIWP